MEPALSQMTCEEDLEPQALALDQVLGCHPAVQTSREIVLDICGDADEFGARDGVARALEILVRKGLLSRRDDWYMATAAAVQFHNLPSE